MIRYKQYIDIPLNFDSPCYILKNISLSIFVIIFHSFIKFNNFNANIASFIFLHHLSLNLTNKNCLIQTDR